MTNLHPLFQAALAPFVTSDRLTELADMNVRRNMELFDIYKTLSPADQAHFAPMIQEHIDRTDKIVKRLRGDAMIN